MIDFETKFAGYCDRANKAIQEWMPVEDPGNPEIVRAMRYALGAGGKRIRPVLLMATADLLGAKRDACPAAAALEFLHSYTLIHDDLPCMDDSSLRRGKPSVHIEFGETIGVLAGDALLTEAFHVLGSAYGKEAECGIELVRILAEAAGANHLVGGQAADTLWENRRISAEMLDFIHLNKTAALMRASMVMGAVLSDANDGDLSIVGKLGNLIGLSFQIVDDILDETGDPEVVGKTTGADAGNHKNTYVRFHGLDASQARVEGLTVEALECCAKLPGESTFLRQLIKKLRDRAY